MPVRSPVLSPLDVHFWGYLKKKFVYIEEMTLEDLVHKVQDRVNAIVREKVRFVK